MKNTDKKQHTNKPNLVFMGVYSFLSLSGCHMKCASWLIINAVAIFPARPYRRCPSFRLWFTSTSLLPPFPAPASIPTLFRLCLLIWYRQRFPCLILHGHIFYCTLIYYTHVIPNVDVWGTIYCKRRRKRRSKLLGNRLHGGNQW